MKVTLNNIEQRLAHSIAKERYNNNRKAGVVDVKVGKQSNEEVDLYGMAGEIVVANVLNLYPDFTTQPRSGGYDLLMHDGRRIDVKTTQYVTGRLITTMKKTGEDVDIYILVIGTFPNFEVKGWATSEEMHDKSNIKDLGYGPTYVIEQDDLHDIGELLK